MEDNKELSSISSDKNGIPVEEVAQFYENLPEIYANNDKWHQLTHSWIQSRVGVHFNHADLLPDKQILNLGSGGESYGLPENNILHVDVAPTKFHSSQRYLIADINSLTVDDGCFDVCLCVGSVINYCDAALVIQNIQNALTPGGKLLLEFESSLSLELIFSGGFAKSAVLVKTFYNGKHVRMWAFSENYIHGLLSAAGLKVISRDSLHHISPAVYFFTRNSNFSAKFQPLDYFASRCPGLRRFSSNIIFLCQKTC
jgi:SAM-dependent methyltransferase